MQKGLLCFDLDNTLIASNACHLRAYQLAFQKHHLKKSISSHQILRYFGQGGHILVRHLFPHASSSFIRSLVHDHDYFVLRETAFLAKPFPGAKQLLQHLRRRWKLALVSNCSRKIIFALLRATNIPHSWFAAIVGNDTVRHPKPAPDELLKAEKLLHMQADYMIGDSIYDIRAARRAHIPVIAIPSGVHKKATLAREKPDYLLQHLSALRKLL